MVKVVWIALALYAVAVLANPPKFTRASLRASQRAWAIFGIKIDLETPTTLDLLELFNVVGAVGILLASAVFWFWS